MNEPVIVGSVEFAVIGRRDIDLWDDADGEVDAKWQTMMQEVLNDATTARTALKSTKDKTARKYPRKRITLRRA